MPAHSSGAVAARLRLAGIRSTKLLRHDNALRVAAERAAAEMLVGAAVSHRHVGAVLLEARAAFRARATGIDEAADSDDVADLEFFTAIADRSHATDDLVTGTAG